MTYQSLEWVSLSRIRIRILVFFRGSDPYLFFFSRKTDHGQAFSPRSDPGQHHPDPHPYLEANNNAFVTGQGQTENLGDLG